MTTQLSVNNQSWTTEQLISLSSNLANVYGANLSQAKKGDRQNEWTTEQLINLSQAFI